MGNRETSSNQLFVRCVFSQSPVPNPPVPRNIISKLLVSNWMRFIRLVFMTVLRINLFLSISLAMLLNYLSNPSRNLNHLLTKPRNPHSHWHYHHHHQKPKSFWWRPTPISLDGLRNLDTYFSRFLFQYSES